MRQFRGSSMSPMPGCHPIAGWVTGKAGPWPMGALCVRPCRHQQERAPLARRLATVIDVPRLPGYEDLNDAGRLCAATPCKALGGQRSCDCRLSGLSQSDGRFKMVADPARSLLTDLVGRRIDHVHQRRRPSCSTMDFEGEPRLTANTRTAPTMPSSATISITGRSEGMEYETARKEAEEDCLLWSF
jgi:hypothetical protein